MYSEEERALAKDTVEAIKKISKRGINPITGASLTVPEWEWKPKVGEWCVMDNPLFPTPHLICVHNFNDSLKRNIKHYIPLLHWERIEEMLWELGYWMRVRRIEKNRCQAMIGRVPGHNQVHRWVAGKNYTEAIQKAIIKAVKEKISPPVIELTKEN